MSFLRRHLVRLSVIALSVGGGRTPSLVALAEEKRQTIAARKVTRSGHTQGEALWVNPTNGSAVGRAG